MEFSISIVSRHSWPINFERHLTRIGKSFRAPEELSSLFNYCMTILISRWIIYTALALPLESSLAVVMFGFRFECCAKPRTSSSSLSIKLIDFLMRVEFLFNEKTFSTFCRANRNMKISHGLPGGTESDSWKCRNVKARATSAQHFPWIMAWSGSSMHKTQTNSVIHRNMRYN